MTTPGPEVRWRDALLDAMIADPGHGLPPMAAVDRRAFWPRFDEKASWLLRVGFFVATCVIVGLGPWLAGHRRRFVRLDQAARDDVLGRIEHVPGGADLLQVVKLVACFAYFADPAVQVAVRGAPRA